MLTTTKQQTKAIRDELLYTRECRSYYKHYRKAAADQLWSCRREARIERCDKAFGEVLALIDFYQNQFNVSIKKLRDIVDNI